jgi:phage shock protein C
MIAGVCAGIAERLSWSTTRVRVAFVLLGLFGAGELLYVVLWVLMPKE